MTEWGIADKAVSLGMFFHRMPQRPKGLLNALEPYPINGYPGHIFMLRAQSVGLQGILMHQLVSQIPIHTAHDGVPGELRAVKFHALQTTTVGNKHPSTSVVKYWIICWERWCRHTHTQNLLHSWRPWWHQWRIPCSWWSRKPCRSC